MIPVYAWNPATRHLLSTALNNDQEDLPDWREFVRVASGSDVAVIAIEAERAEEGFRQLLRFSERHATRIVLVLEDRIRDDTLLGRVRAYSVVRHSEVPRRLPEAITTARAAAWRLDVAALFAVSDRVPFLIKAAVAYACDDLSGPPRSVQAIAKAVGSDPVAIAHRWRSFHACSIRFLDVLHWIQLDWACLYRPHHRDWAQTAAHLGVSEPALRRHAKRCLDMSLSQVWRQGRRDLHRKFDEAVLIPLLGLGARIRAEPGAFDSTRKCDLPGQLSSPISVGDKGAGRSFMNSLAPQ